MGANWLIFALDPKLEMDTDTLVLHSGQKFMCFVVQFHEKFRFWNQIRIVPEKVYAVIWPLLEISSLKVSFCKKSTLTGLSSTPIIFFIELSLWRQVHDINLVTSIFLKAFQLLHKAFSQKKVKGLFDIIAISMIKVVESYCETGKIQ